MSATVQNTQNASSQPCHAPDYANLPTSKDAIKQHTASDSEEPAAAVEGGPAKNVPQTDEQIPNAEGLWLGITHAQERDKEDYSKFWATYDTVSMEYDDDFLSRANDDMGIILTFAGLFSAVNSTFIIGMQPNPGNNTNVLLLNLIKIIADPNGVHDISNLSSSTGFPSSTVWMQALAYSSLLFSLLAAFGAVMGKQWLNAYKGARGRGSLEERGMQRQRKLDGLMHFHLQTVLQAFLVLLQISLLLFGLSLSANMWTQQTTISSVIICTTASGILFYAGTIIVSMLRPDSPFQTPGSEAMKAIWKKYFPDRSTSTLNDTLIKLTAMRWILETSTNPKVVEAAAGMVPLVQWPQKFDASATYARLRDNFVACRDSEEVFVKCGRAMAHLWGQSLDIHPSLRWKSWYTWDRWGGKSRFIRDAFMDSRDAYKQLTSTQQQTARRTHNADVRTALRTMVVHGISDRFSLPDDEDLIWYGDLRWRHSDGLVPRCEEFDWLIDYLADEAAYKGDDETEGDALLALGAMHRLGSCTKRRSYITTLIRCMGPTRPPRIRHAALRAVSNAREELASMTKESMPEGVDGTLLDKLSCAVLTAVRPNQDETIHNGPDASFHHDRDRRYASLIFALAINDEWHERLNRDGHLQRCTYLIEENLQLRTSLVEENPESRHWILGCYLAGIFTCINPSNEVLPLSSSQEKWPTLVRTMWKRNLTYFSLDAIPDLVTVTRQNLRGVNSAPDDALTDLAGDVRKALESLQEIQADILPLCVIASADVDAALSSLQGLYDDLRRMIDNPKTLPRDDDVLGSLES